MDGATGLFDVLKILFTNWCPQTVWRYVHIPAPDASESRRGSAPAVLSPARGEQTFPARRGSEPWVVGSQRLYGQGRRGSEPLVTNTATLERSFEHLTTRIAEEEDGYTETTPPHNQQGTIFFCRIGFAYLYEADMWCCPTWRSWKITSICYILKEPFSLVTLLFLINV